MAGLAGFLTILEPFAKQAIQAMAPDLAAAFAKLLPGTIAPAPVGGADVAPALNLQKALPAATAADFDVVKAIAGRAVAKYLETNPGANLQDPAVFSSIASLTSAGIATEGLDAAMIMPNTLRQIVSTAIEMSVAGLGVKPTVVGVRS